MKILIIEDDRGLAEGIAFSMERDGYEVSHVGTLVAARKLLESEKPDVILLDLTEALETVYFWRRFGYNP